MTECLHPDSLLTMMYFEHSRIGADVPYLQCRCGAELPQRRYACEFAAWLVLRAQNPA